MEDQAWALTMRWTETPHRADQECGLCAFLSPLADWFVATQRILAIASHAVFP